MMTVCRECRQGLARREATGRERFPSCQATNKTRRVIIRVGERSSSYAEFGSHEEPGASV